MSNQQGASRGVQDYRARIAVDDKWGAGSVLINPIRCQAEAVGSYQIVNWVPMDRTINRRLVASHLTT